MPIYGMLILQSIRCSPTLWAVTQPSQFRSIMDKDEFVREPQISLYSKIDANFSFMIHNRDWKGVVSCILYLSLHVPSLTLYFIRFMSLIKIRICFLRF